MYICNNLVSNAITTELKKKITSDLVSVQSSDTLNIYLSNTGNDNTGNGSKDHPYKTLNKIITSRDHLRKKPYRGVNIILLSDIVDDVTTRFFDIGTQWFINFDTTNGTYTLTFNNRIDFYRSFARLSNCKFNKTVCATSNSYLELSQCEVSIDNSSTDGSAIYSQYGSTITLINGLTINGVDHSDTTIHSGCVARRNGCIIIPTGTITANGKFNQLFLVNGVSKIDFVANVATIKSGKNLSGMRYYVVNHSILDLKSHGLGVFPSELTEGYVDDLSSVG